MSVAFIIAAVTPILLHSASNVNAPKNKPLGDRDTANGYWFSYDPDSSCSKCNCSVTVSNEITYYDNPSFVLNVNKSDCKYKHSLDRECTCYGYPDYFIGTKSSTLINGSMGDSWCIGAMYDEYHPRKNFLSCRGVHRSETIIFTLN